MRIYIYILIFPLLKNMWVSAYSLAFESLKVLLSDSMYKNHLLPRTLPYLLKIVTFLGSVWLLNISLSLFLFLGYRILLYIPSGLQLSVFLGKPPESGVQA